MIRELSGLSLPKLHTNSLVAISGKLRQFKMYLEYDKRTSVGKETGLRRIYPVVRDATLF